MTGRPLPATARELRAALRELVSAAQRQDAAALADAGAAVGRVDAEQVRVVLGHVVRGLVERSSPDGVDADDLSTLLHDVVRGTAWCAGASPSAVVAVLGGAFGVHPDDDSPPRPGATDVGTAAALLTAHLLHGQDVAPLLDAALAEVARAETVELP